MTPRPVDRWLRLGGLLALLLPTLIAFDGPPSRSALNQQAALAAWGLFGVALAATCWPTANLRDVRGLRGLLAALGVLALAVIASMVQRGFPLGLGLSALGFYAAAALCAGLGGLAQRSGTGDRAFDAFCAGLVAASVVGAGIGLVQLFAPQFIDGFLVGLPTAKGRIGGNLRQPNHLSSLLVAGLAALVWLHDAARRARGGRTVAFVAGAVLLVLATAGTASRTGTLCILLLCLWGVLDRNLAPMCRRVLWGMPVLYGLCWWGLELWAAAGVQGFAGQTVMNAADVSSSRFGAWSNVIDLVKMNPWTGVGWGEFNLAWTLTPFAHRPVALFDHTHNLVLQWLVELGLPLTLLVLGLILAALWQVAVACRHAVADDRPMARCALVMLAMIGAHSLLEYPLWYAYFLLPAAFVFGLALGARRAAAPAVASSGGRATAAGLGVAALLLSAAGVFAMVQYRVVLAMWDAEGQPALLAQRIEEGRRSVFFAAQAELAAATLSGTPPTDPRQYDQVRHLFLEPRVLVAMSRAYAAQGDLERARYLAQRLKDLKSGGAGKFFEPCRQPDPGTPLPYQCVPPQGHLTFADFQADRAPSPRP